MTVNKQNYQLVAAFEKGGKGIEASPDLDFLSQKLKAVFGEDLKAHQGEALTLIHQGKNVVLGTSIGKSQVFTLPVLQKLMLNPDATSIFLVPEKAQLKEKVERFSEALQKLDLPESYVYCFDGTVGGAALRKQMVARSKVLFTTPQLLHSSILRASGAKEHRDFFRNLQFVILDQCHNYHGVYGSNVALLLRRMRQVIQWEGAEPKFIAQATTTEPEAHMKDLTGLDFETVDPGIEANREYRFLAPEAQTPCGLAAALALESLPDKQVLLFSQEEADLKEIKKILDKDKVLAANCAIWPFQEKEQDKLKKLWEEGQLSCLLTTKLSGFDFFSPQKLICCGIGQPQTSGLFSFLNQDAREYDVDLINSGSLADAFYFRHPELFFRRPTPRLNLENQRLLQDHAVCARFEAKERKGRKLDEEILGAELIKQLKRPPQGRSFAFAHSFIQNKNPHMELKMYSVNDPSYKMFVGKKRMLGELAWSQVLQKAYLGAIYRHKSKRYRVNKITSGRIEVEPITEKEIKVSPITEIKVKKRFAKPSTKLIFADESLSVNFGWFNILTQVVGYQEEKQGKSKEYLYPEESLSRFMVTQGLELVLDKDCSLPMAKAFGQALFQAAPLVANVKGQDLLHDFSSEDGRFEFRLLDAAEGGLALAWQLKEQLPAIIAEAEEILAHASMEPLEEDLDFEGGAKLAKSLVELLAAAEEEKEKKPQEATDEAKANTGFMLAEGATVFITGVSKVGEVISSSSYDQDRLYRLSVEGEERQFVGASLELIRGELQLWCLGCNQEAIPTGTTTCPKCGRPLADEYRVPAF